MRVSMATIGIPSPSSPEAHPIDPRHEPSALEGWILEILGCDPKGSRGFLRILSTKGQSDGLYMVQLIKSCATDYLVCVRGRSYLDYVRYPT